MPLQFPSMFLGGDTLPPVKDYILWLDFGDSDAMFLADGSHPNASTPVGTRITQVKDKSPLDNSALTFPAGGTKGFIYNRPLSGNGLNGRSTVESDGTGVLTGGWAYYENLVVYVVFQCRGNVNDKGRIFSQMVYDNAGGTWTPLVYNNSVSVTSLSTTGGAVAGVTLGTNVWRTIQHRKSGFNAINKVNGIASNSGPISVGDPMNPKQGYLIGGQLSLDLTSISSLVKGLYAEVIAFNRVLTTAEELAMSDYFKAKWGSGTAVFSAGTAERPLTTAEIDLLNPGIVHAKRTLSPANKIAAIKVASPASVDWGDGSPLEDAAANVQLEHTYAATTGEVVVTIASKTAAGLNPNLSVKHAGSVDAGWHEIIISDHRMDGFTVKPNPSLRTLRIKGDHNWTTQSPTNLNGMPDIEEIEIDKFHPLGKSAVALCKGNTKLKRFICHTTAEGFTLNNAFEMCKSLDAIQWDFNKAVNLNQFAYKAVLNFPVNFDFPNLVDGGAAFSFATIPNTVNVTGTNKTTTVIGFAVSPATTFNRASYPVATKASGMHYGSTHLVNHPGMDCPKLQDTSQVFMNCLLLETIGDFDMSSANYTLNMFTGSRKLRSFTLRGLKVSIDIINMNLSATALDAIFTSLGTANAGATINILGNPGAATCNKTIATAKGWTVTG